MSESVLQQQLPEPHYKGLCAHPKKFSSHGKRHSSIKHEGKIRVSTDVLAALKQVSAELDVAQRHYLAYKQYGPAADR